MLPDLRRLSLNGNCRRCRPQAAVGVTRTDYDADNSEECSLCFYPLSDERPGLPWHDHYGLGYSDDGLPEFLIEACLNRHVFHKVCLEQAYIHAANSQVSAECPYCKDPLKRQAYLMMRNRNEGPPYTNHEHPNPFSYSAPNFFTYEWNRARMKLRRFVIALELKRGPDDETGDETMNFFTTHNYNNLSLQDFFPPDDVEPLTVDEASEILDKVTLIRNTTRRQLMQQTDEDLVPLYQEMMAYHERILAVLMTNPRVRSLMEEDIVDEAPAGGATWNASDVAAIAVSMAISLPFAPVGYVDFDARRKWRSRAPSYPPSGTSRAGTARWRSARKGSTWTCR